MGNAADRLRETGLGYLTRSRLRPLTGVGKGWAALRGVTGCAPLRHARDDKGRTQGAIDDC